MKKLVDDAITATITTAAITTIKKKVAYMNNASGDAKYKAYARMIKFRDGATTDGGASLPASLATVADAFIAEKTDGSMTLSGPIGLYYLAFRDSQLGSDKATNYTAIGTLATAYHNYVMKAYKANNASALISTNIAVADKVLYALGVKSGATKTTLANTIPEITRVFDLAVALTETTTADPLASGGIEAALIITGLAQFSNATSAGKIYYNAHQIFKDSSISANLLTFLGKKNRS